VSLMSEKYFCELYYFIYSSIFTVRCINVFPLFMRTCTDIQLIILNLILHFCVQNNFNIYYDACTCRSKSKIFKFVSRKKYVQIVYF
jgi:hypothetical protein